MHLSAAPNAGSIVIPLEISVSQNPMLKIDNFDGIGDCQEEFTHQKLQLPKDKEPSVKTKPDGLAQKSLELFPV